MIPLVYIASPSYSGSTLLAFILNAHPRIATVGELKWGPIDLETYACSCGALLRECPFWRIIETAVRSRGLPFDLNRPPTDFRDPARPGLNRLLRTRVRNPLFEAARDALLATDARWVRARATISAVNRAVVDATLAYFQADIFVDASKDPVRLKHLLATGAYDVHVIQLIRDGRGVVNSAIAHQKVSAAHATREWARTHTQIERLARRLKPGRLLPLRYEDLCADAEGTLGRMFRFLGLARPATRDFRGAEHHILGNAMRLRPFRAIQLDEKWRSMLPEHDRRVFARLAGHLNRKYQYD